MNFNIVVFIKDAKKGTSKNWIILKAFAERFDKNKVYEINFCGTEANSSIPLTDKQNETLKELLIQDFGYAPYDIDKAKKIIGNGKQYTIKNYVECLDC